MKLIFAASAAVGTWLALASPALAQSSPCFIPLGGSTCRALQTNDVPTATQWNSFYTAKQDVLTSSSLLAIIGSPTGFMFGNGSGSPTGYSAVPGSLATFTPPWTGGVLSTIQTRDALGANVQDFGASGSTATAPGSSITGGTAHLTLGSAQDFANGEGVSVPGAGLTAPGAASCTATAKGTTGSTTINYYVVTLGLKKGYASAASSNCQVTNANATLNAQNTVQLTITIPAASSFTGSIAGNVLSVTAVSSGVLAQGETIVASGVGSPERNVRIAGYGTGTGGTGTYYLDWNTASFNGSIAGTALTISSSGSPSGTPWGGQTLAGTGIGAGVTLSTMGANNLSWTLSANEGTIASEAMTTSVASESMTAYVGVAIYKSGGNFGSEALLGTTDQTTYNDVGLASSAPDSVSWLSSTHPTSAKNDDCARQISSGGGTTALTLSATCPNSASGATVLHDDTAAFNACLLAISGECRVPCGNYNVSASLLFGGNDRLHGRGRCSEINWYGVEDLFVAFGTKGSLLYGNDVSDLYVNGQNYSALGRSMTLGYLSQAGPWKNLFFNQPFDGIYMFNGDFIKSMDSISISSMGSQTGSCFKLYNDGANGGAFGQQTRFACSVAGGTSNYGTQQKCFWLDGAVAGGNFSTPLASACAGEGMRISNDMNALGGAPFAIKADEVDMEYTTGPGTHLVAAANGNSPSQIHFEGGHWTDSGWKDFVSCDASANFVVDPGVDQSDLVGGQFQAASGAGLYIGGPNFSARPAQVNNNSNAGSGGTVGACDGVDIGGANDLLTGAVIGHDGHKQAYPIKLLSGAGPDVVVGNSLIALGQVTNQNFVNDASGNTTNFVSCNAGSVPSDCAHVADVITVPYASSPYTYTPSARMQTVDVACIGGGGGGGSGAVTVSGTAASGGGGGGSASGARATFTAAQIGASQTVTIGAAGTGGTSPAAGSSTAGGNGGAGGNTTFGSLLKAWGGGGGAGGQISGVSGGGGSAGFAGAGGSSTNSTAGAAGADGGAAGSAGAAPNNNYYPGLGGPGAGAAISGGVHAGGDGQVASGGGTGGLLATTPANTGGGAGGNLLATGTSTTAGAAGGSGGGGAGGAGSSALVPGVGALIGGTGGGGGGSNISSSAAGGAGGAGGIGAGGGGGGSTLTTDSAQPGAGGAGGAGECVITENF